MATVKVTQDSIQSLLKDNPVVILDFWAEWCGPCRGFAPVFEAASEKYPDIVFGKVDVDSEQTIAGEYGIRSIPTIAVIKNGELVHMQSGALPPPMFDQLIRAMTADADEA